jgi:hypothetical protein
VKRTLWLLILVPLGLLGADQIIIQSAESRAEGDLTVLSGMVRLEIKGQVLMTADEIRYHRKSGDVTLIGNIKVDYTTEKGIMQLSAQEVVANLHEGWGRFFEVEARFEEQFIFQGKQVNVLSDQRFELIEGSLTACTRVRPEWLISLRRAELRLNGYSRLFHVVFQLKGAPVLYLPFLLLPTFEDRHSGLLLPNTGSSKRNGTFFQQPLYWAGASWWDVTLAPIYLQKTGWGATLEARYRPGPLAKGLLNGRIQQDELLKEQPAYEAGKAIPTRRFHYEWDHVQPIFGGGLHVQARHGSDFQVERDFQDALEKGRFRTFFHQLQWQKSVKGMIFGFQLEETRTLFGDGTQIGSMERLPGLSLSLPAKALRGQLFLRGKAHMGLLSFQEYGGSDAFQANHASGEVELSQSRRWGKWLNSKTTLHFSGRSLSKDASGESQDTLWLNAGVELTSPKFFRTYALGNQKIEHFADFGLDVRWNELDETQSLSSLLLDDTEHAINDAIDGLDLAWVFRSTVFREQGKRSSAGLELEMRKRINTEEKKSPLELIARLPSAWGVHLNTVAHYQTESNRFSLATLYGSVKKGSWLGAFGYVYRDELNQTKQHSLISWTHWKSPGSGARFRVGFDYDFELSLFKSQDAMFRWDAQCWGLSISYQKTPFATVENQNSWVRLAVHFRNLGELGSRF